MIAQAISLGMENLVEMLTQEELQERIQEACTHERLANASTMGSIKLLCKDCNRMLIPEEGEG